jgi:hypothetical protein
VYIIELRAIARVDKEIDNIAKAKNLRCKGDEVG